LELQSGTKVIETLVKLGLDCRALTLNPLPPHFNVVSSFLRHPGRVLIEEEEKEKR